MLNKIIVAAALFAIYYTLGGLATTNMLRLTKGNTLPVISSKCACDNCGAKITPFFQMPIISFIVCRGRCRSCGSKIPVYPLILEITVFISMTAATLLSRFSYSGVVISFALYEIIRVAVILLRGRRAEHFIREYIIAVILMLPYMLFGFFCVALYKVV